MKIMIDLVIYYYTVSSIVYYLLLVLEHLNYYTILNIIVERLNIIVEVVQKRFIFALFNIMLLMGASFQVNRLFLIYAHLTFLVYTSI